MATITRENIGPLNEKITVKVGREDYFSAFEKALKTYGKQANIPGFRKGMVPAGMIKKMHGQAVFTDEVLRTVEKELNNYMSNEKLDIFAQPLPLLDDDSRKLDVNNPAEYAFAFEVGLKPEFEVPDLKQVTLPLYKVTVTPEMVQEEVDRLRVRHGNMTNPELVTGDDNLLNITFIETDAEGNETVGGIRKDNSLLVKYFDESFRPQLLNKKTDDSVMLQIESAFASREREWILSDLGLTDDATAPDKHFKMLITKVGLVEQAPMDDTLFKAVFPGKEITTEEEFRKEIEAEIQAYWNKQASNHQQHELYHYLLDHTQVNFPEDFLKRWMQNGGEQQKSQHDVEHEFPSFISQLKWTLISDKVVREQGIEIAPEEIRQLAKQQLLGYAGMEGGDTEQPWMAEYIERMMHDRKFVEETYHRIQTNKIFDWAASQVNSEEMAVSVEQFRKEMEKHQHHSH